MFSRLLCKCKNVRQLISPQLLLRPSARALPARQLLPPAARRHGRRRGKSRRGGGFQRRYGRRERRAARPLASRRHGGGSPRRLEGSGALAAAGLPWRRDVAAAGLPDGSRAPARSRQRRLAMAAFLGSVIVASLGGVAASAVLSRGGGGSRGRVGWRVARRRLFAGRTSRRHPGAAAEARQPELEGSCFGDSGLVSFWGLVFGDVTKARHRLC